MLDLTLLRDQDIRSLWHPYTDITAFESAPHTCIERAQGVYLYEAGGRPILDGISSWWAVALGHGHPRLVEAIQRQAGKLQHSILGKLSHPGAIELATRLVDVTPTGLNHVYFAADGASATEAALKIAIQYWYNIGETGRDQFVGLADGYHGDTLGAVGVGYVPRFHRPFKNVLLTAYRAEAPHCPRVVDDAEDQRYAVDKFASMEALVRKHHARLAGVIVEPLCQGAAGIRIYHPEYLCRLRALCDEFGLMLIADEIAVGFGRTGSLFACDKAGVTPDILCLGKAMTGGYLPMSAALVTDTVYDAFRSDAQADRTFYDGHTFCGNPITSAAALAALDVYVEEDIASAARANADLLHRGMKEIGAYSCVDYFKSLGMIGMCVFSEQAGGAALAARVADAALRLGLFIRPLGPVLYLWPPLTTSESELREMITLFKEAVEQSV